MSKATINNLSILADTLEDDIYVVYPEIIINILREAAEAIETLQTKTDDQQARIDSLMFEHCPDEMTEDQIKTFEKHQVPQQ